MKTKSIDVHLYIENLSRKLDETKEALSSLTELSKDSEELREWATNEITRFALSVRASKLDKDELNNFFEYPYVIIPGKNDNERYLAIPKFIDAQFGWLHKVTPSFNIFLINPYVDWLGELPDAIKKEMNFPDPLDVFLDGEYIVGSDTKKAYEKYSEFIARKEKDGRLLINKTRHFDFLARLIKDGVRPFTYKSIDKEDFVTREHTLELRDYQLEAYETWTKYSNIGVFFPPSTGKTWLGLYAMSTVKGPWLVAVPSRLLVEQWEDRIQLYTDLELGVDVDVMTYQSAIIHGHKKEYNGKIIDEVHHLPANLFSKLSTISTKYMIGLSATPQREDERENYIFALTGQPVGLSWGHFKKLGIIQTPDLHVWIVKSDVDRFKRLGDLLSQKKKSIIFSDSLEMGRMVSKRFDIPFVSGDSKQRLDKIQDNLQTVVSRVGDEGVSLPTLEQVIEISWLHGSRRQELQRFTRLLHGKDTKGIGHIIMTVQEYQKDHKRLFGIMDKGFKIILHREGISDKVIQQAKENSQKPSRKKQIITTVHATSKQTIEPNNFEINHPILSLPGIQKKLIQTNKGERAIVNLLFQREGQEFDNEGLSAILGYKNGNALAASVSFKKLHDLKLVSTVNGKHKADLSLMGLTKN